MDKMDHYDIGRQEYRRERMILVVDMLINKLTDVQFDLYLYVHINQWVSQYSMMDGWTDASIEEVIVGSMA